MELPVISGIIYIFTPIIITARHTGRYPLPWYHWATWCHWQWLIAIGQIVNSLSITYSYKHARRWILTQNLSANSITLILHAFIVAYQRLCSIPLLRKIQYTMSKSQLFITINVPATISALRVIHNIISLRCWYFQISTLSSQPTRQQCCFIFIPISKRITLIEFTLLKLYFYKGYYHNTRLPYLQALQRLQCFIIYWSWPFRFC